MRQVADTLAWVSTKAASGGAQTPAALLRPSAPTWPGGLALDEGATLQGGTGRLAKSLESVVSFPGVIR